jgi:DNA modification methylase
MVLDPFCGSGTTGVVCQALGRRFVGVDLSEAYLQLARERTGAKALEEWSRGRDGETELDELPLFADCSSEGVVG